jgi:hypothetical protein
MKMEMQIKSFVEILTTSEDVLRQGVEKTDR